MQTNGSVATTAVITYIYDPLDHVTAATYSKGQRFEYAYDSVGELRDATVTIASAQVIPYEYVNADHVTKAICVTYTSDNDGRGNYQHFAGHNRFAIHGLK